MGIVARPLAERFLEKYKINTETGCWDWTASVKRNGYGQIGIPGPKATMLDAHRASWIIHRGPVPKGKMVLHRCDVKTCVNPDHLWLGTQKDNMRDMMAKGRGREGPGSNGEQHYAARFTWEQIRAIRADTRTQVAIAAAYRTSQGYISHIKLHKKWRYDPEL